MWPLEILQAPAWRPLTWTLLYFVWQGAIVALAWVVLFRLSRGCRTQFRYLLGLAGMFLMAACPVATFVFLESEATQYQAGWDEARAVVAPTPAPIVSDMPKAVPLPMPSLGEIQDLPAVGSDATPWRLDLAERIGDVQPYLLCGWILGLMCLSGRLLLGVVGAHRLGRGRLALSGEIADRTSTLAARMGFRAVPRVFSSRAACEAVVTGLLRPIVLLPVAWLAEMSPEVLEAVIAHELAHIRRFDLWFNLFQRVVETLLFYHPAVWWLSRRVRLAREMCCDELAAKATGERVVYATALELAARKRLEPAKSLLEVALGVTRMTLLDRVRNVLGLAARHEQGRWWPAAVLTLLVPPAVWLASMAAVTSAEDKTPAVAEPAASEPIAVEPAASKGRTDRLVLNIDRDGNLSTTRPIKNIDEFLAAEVKAVMLAHHITPADRKAGRELPTTVLIHVETGTPYEKVERVIRTCQEHGFSKYAFHVKKAEPAPIPPARHFANVGENNTATVLLRISMQENTMVGGSAAQIDRDRFDIYKNTQAALLTSRYVLRAALQKPEVARLPSIERERAAGNAENWLEHRLTVKFPGNVEVMAVSVRGDDSKEAAVLVNAIVDAYISEVVNAESSRKIQRLSDLEKLYAEREQELRKKRETLKSMARESGASDSGALDVKQKLALEELSLLRQEVAKSQVDLRRYQVELAVQNAFLEDAKGKDREPILKEIKRIEVSSKVTSKQTEDLAKQIQKMTDEAGKFGVESVGMEMLRADLKNLVDVQAQLAAEMEKLRVLLNTAPRVSLLERAE